MKLERVDSASELCDWCNDQMEYGEEALRLHGRSGHLDCAEIIPIESEPRDGHDGHKHDPARLG